MVSGTSAQTNMFYPMTERVKCVMCALAWLSVKLSCMKGEVKSSTIIFSISRTIWEEGATPVIRLKPFPTFIGRRRH